MLLEFNTRVDVLMLGLFWGDELVGVYSFAAMLVEGLTQVPIVIRTNVNPLLAQYIGAGAHEQLATLARKTKRTTYIGMLLIGIAAVAVYPFGVQWVTDAPAFLESVPMFIVLMAGLVLSSGYLPFSQILLQAGRPATHTGLTTGTVGFNVLGNLIAIPLFRGVGAAAATALSFVMTALAVRWLAARWVGVRL
jgi:O-antigen/teichoic acid export membrane protein